MQLSSMIGTKVDESEVVDKIIQFNEFKNFYNTKWKRLKENGKSIYWYINPACKAYAAQGFYLSDGKHKPWIQLCELPETPDDAFLTAHEIEHVIMWFDGQYLDIKINPRIEGCFEEGAINDLACKLGSMFDDPLVDRFLQDEYHFNIFRRYTEFVIPKTKESLNSFGDSEYDLYRLANALFYSQFSLQADLIKDEDAEHLCSDLKELYKEKRPIAARMGEELYGIAKKIDYDTLEKQKTLFHKIADNYMIGGGHRLCDALYID
jgi:hypothetical protein